MTWIGLTVDPKSLQLPEEATVATEELHLTLSYLGEHEEFSHLPELIETAGTLAEEYGPGPLEVTVAGYGIIGDANALVLFVNSDQIYSIHKELENLFDLDYYRRQFRPWLSHITVSFDALPKVWLDEMIGKTILLDKVTVHHADETYTWDI